MKYFLLGLLCVAFIHTAYAQLDFSTNYYPISASGNIPKPFIESYKEILLHNSDKTNNKITLEEQQEFILVNNALLQRTLQSGRVLYNDTITNYINSISNRIAEANPDFNVNINLYSSKVSIPNAAAWSNGVILFNIGLIAHLETEAQLAFILAHEMAHVQKQHSLQKYILDVNESLSKRKKQRKKQLRGKAFGRGNLDLDCIFRRYRYSRKYEMEADDLGLQYLKNTPYNTKDVISTLNLLIDIDKDQFTLLPPQGYYNPDSLLSKAISQHRSKNTEQQELDSSTTQLDAMLDSIRTHPSIKERVEQLQSKLGKQLGESFIGSPLKFIEIKTIARFELIESYFEAMNYHRALYESLQLLQEYPLNQYLKQMICKSAFWYTLMENQSEREIFTPQNKNLENQVYGIFAGQFRGIKKDKRSRWCLNLLAKYALENPEITELTFLQAQAEEHLGKKEKAKKLYKALLITTKEPYRNFILDKLESL